MNQKFCVCSLFYFADGAYVVKMRMGVNDIFQIKAVFFDNIKYIIAVVASIDYRERALQLKVKPNTVDGAAMALLRSALQARQLELTEATPGTWQIRRQATPKPSAKA